MLSTSIIIITKGRPVELERCLQHVLKQTKLPDEVVIIEDVSDTPKQDLSRFKKKFKKKKLSFVQKYVKFCNYAKSRNLGIEIAQNQYIIFLDDDVFLEPNSIKTMLEFELEQPQMVIQGGKTKPLYRNLWTEFRAAYLTSCSLLETNPVRAGFTPTSLMGLHRVVLTAHNLTFPDLEGTGEDLLFCLNASQKGVSIMINPNLWSPHSISPSFWSFYSRHFQYSVGRLHVSELNDAVFNELDHYLPTRLLDLAGLPLKVLFSLLHQPLLILQEKKLTPRYYLPILLDQTTMVLAQYGTRKGREVFMNRVERITAKFKKRVKQQVGLQNT